MPHRCSIEVPRPKLVNETCGFWDRNETWNLRDRDSQLFNDKNFGTQFFSINSVHIRSWSWIHEAFYRPDPIQIQQNSS